MDSKFSNKINCVIDTCFSGRNNSPEANKHYKTPRKERYNKNFQEYAKKDNGKDDKYLQNMKQRLYQNFIKNFSKDLKGTNVELKPGESEQIMIEYLIDKDNNDHNQSDK